MPKQAVAVLLLALLCAGGGATLLHAQEGGKRGASALGSNAEGVHFLVGFMQNETDVCSPPSIHRVVSIASRFHVDVTVTFPDGYVVTRKLAPYEITKVSIDERFECTGEGVFRNAIEIRSTEPISVYCYNSRTHTSDGYLALPVNAWGMQYVTANYALDHYTPRDSSNMFSLACDVAPRGGEFAILASESNTAVTVYPKTKTVDGYRPGDLITRILDKGEILQIQDGGSIRGASDITGSIVVSDKPVGVLSGHMRAAVPWTLDTKDHLIEMLPPREMLSTEYVAVPFGGRKGGDLIRVISADPGTTTVTIRKEGAKPEAFDLASIGAFMEYDLREPVVIRSTKPVMVAHYSRSAMADPTNKDSGRAVVNFDPNMVMITPTDQYVNAAVFQTLPNRISNAPNAAKQFDRHLLTLVVEQEYLTTTTLDGRKLSDFAGITMGQVPDGTGKYLWATLEVSDGTTHVLLSDGLLAGFVYGMGTWDSYAWAIGSGMRRLKRADVTKPRFTVERLCDSYKVRALDSGLFESGLKRVWLDSSASTNAVLEFGVGIDGDDFRTGRVTTRDPMQPGSARIIAEDMFRNRDTFNLTLDVLAPVLTPDAISARGTPGGKIQLKEMTISNTGNAVMMVDSVRILRGREFTLVTRHSGREIYPAGSLTVGVAFKSDAIGTYTDTLLIWCNCRLYMIPLTGRVIGPSIATEDLEYGAVRVGRNRTLDVRVWNNGAAELTIDSMQTDAGVFTLAGPVAYPIDLEPDEVLTLPFRFNPSATTDFTGEVRFFSSAGDPVTAHLHGVGVYPRLALGGHDYGALHIGDTALWRVAVVNSGSDTAFLRGVATDDPVTFAPEKSDFRYDLPMGDTLWVSYGFKPTGERSYRSAISVKNDDGLEAVAELVGSGYHLRAAIGGYDWGARWVGSTHDTLVAIRNTDARAITIDSVWIDAGDISDFAATPLDAPITLPAGGEAMVPVRFSPLQPGLRECLIKAGTGSRIMPIIENKLEGFGLIALAEDAIEFDASVAVPCEARTGRVTIKNDGNTPLTIAEIGLATTSPLVKANLPAVGHVLAVGDFLTVEYTIDFAGQVDTVTGSIYWRFAEIGATYSREFGLRSEPQEYRLSATAPGSVSFGRTIDLAVEVESALWEGMPQSGATVTVAYNPRMARFSLEAWKVRADTVGSGWRIVGDPLVDPAGLLTLRFEPVGGGSARLDPFRLPEIPFRVFIGDSPLDTFVVTMSTGCAAPVTASVPYMIDSVCGLSQRLIVVTGEGYALRQNAPNPVSGMTQIDFTVGLDAHTRLEVYGPGGALQRVLVDEVLAAGQYTATFDASELPSGLYYYRIDSGPFTSIKRMHIIK